MRELPIHSNGDILMDSYKCMIPEWSANTNMVKYLSLKPSGQTKRMFRESQNLETISWKPGTELSTAVCNCAY